MSSSATVYVSAIAAPNPPPLSETTNTVWTLPTTTAAGPKPTFVEQVTFQLYGGSKNNNDQVVKDWKSTQTAAFTKANIAFDVNQGYNIDGYVFEAKLKIVADPGFNNDTVMLCIQQGIAPGINCARSLAATNVTPWSGSTLTTQKSANAQYLNQNGVTPFSLATTTFDCTNASNRNLDGIATCWGRQVTYTDNTVATSATNFVTIRHWLYMASDHADFMNGYRFWKGQ